MRESLPCNLRKSREFSFNRKIFFANCVDERAGRVMVTSERAMNRSGRPPTLRGFDLHLRNLPTLTRSLVRAYAKHHDAFSVNVKKICANKKSRTRRDSLDIP